MSILVVGSLAYDTIETPWGKMDDALGGSALYFSAAASHFSPVNVVGGPHTHACHRGPLFRIDPANRFSGRQCMVGNRAECSGPGGDGNHLSGSDAYQIP